MSDPRQLKSQNSPTTKINSEVGDAVLYALNKYDYQNKVKGTLLFTILLAVCILTVATSTVFFVDTINKMHKTYITETEKIIVTKTSFELSNQWERLPVNQKRERLRAQFYEIIRYYTNRVPDEQKMNDEQILNTFNQLWLCTERLSHVNFFLPIAYLKVKTNFNPVYNEEFQRGIAGFYLKTAERVANLDLTRNDPVFRLAYRGTATLNNPVESVKLLVARIDDLMITFNNREDWVLFSLFIDEHNVISNYWKGGEGAIPDEFYREGQLATALEYYHSFKNWQIPMTQS